MFKENYIINGQIVCDSGLHIGDSTEGIDIGGSDSPIIRDPITEYPYIPGSSLKGKLRSLLELSDKKSSESVIQNKGKVATDEECIATQIFGLTPTDEKNIDIEKNYQTRIIVRDSQPTDETIELWKNHKQLSSGAELKWENTINRITSTANPRNIERVPKDSKFNFEIIFSSYSEEEFKNIIKLLEAMKLLENNYLGGSGSRGSGQIHFENINISKRDIAFYTDDVEEQIIVEGSNIKDAISAIKQL